MASVFAKAGSVSTAISETVSMTPKERALRKIKLEAQKKIREEREGPKLESRDPTFAEARSRIAETKRQRALGLEPKRPSAFLTEESVAAVSDAEVIRQKEKIRTRNRPRGRQSSVFAGLAGQAGGSVGGVSRRVGSVFGDPLG